MYLEEFCSMKWRTCTHPSLGLSLGAHLPAHFHTFNFGTVKYACSWRWEASSHLVKMVGVHCYIPVASVSDFFCKHPKYRVRKLSCITHCLSTVDIRIWASHRETDRRAWVLVGEGVPDAGSLPPSIAPPSYCMGMRTQSSNKLWRSSQDKNEAATSSFIKDAE